ncbi:MAG TPA: diguanylate cyclase [Burkholderiales bacterium]|nr:diguanylate cyclase [Burkholderiales bacterium]
MTWQRHDLSQIIEQIPIGVAVTLPLGTVEYANPHLHRMLGLDAARISGVDLARLKLPGCVLSHEQMKREILADKPWQGETQFRTGAGDTLHVLESVYPLRDVTGRIAHFMHFLQDLSLVKVSETLKNLAFYDSLTGLPNRNLFHDRLAAAMATARRTRHGFAVLSVDIDHFKRVNDSFGHDAGDELLRQIAARLQACLRKTDTIARTGGDEFIAILDQILDSELATKIADKLLAGCCGEYDLHGNRLHITMSIGLSLYPRDGQEADILLKRADLAMYRAKAIGESRHQLRDSAAQCYGFV